MKVLYINGNPQSEDLSYSRRAANYYLDQLKAKNPQVEIEVVNVYEQDIPLIDGDVLSAWASLGQGNGFDTLSEVQQKKLGQMNANLQQFKSADVYVFSTPLWNFSVPPMLKAYIDNVAIAGETFKYTETGSVGLLSHKKAVILQASGGFYQEGPGASLEHGSNFLETVLGFFGITDVKGVYVEGIAIPGKSAEEKLQGAYEQVDALTQ